ncbi:hypothetical protein ACFLVJ_00670 [Chloroflexota bacterium]
MPGRAKHGKGKYAIRGKGESRPGDLAAGQPAVIQNEQPAPPTAVPTPSVKTADPAVKPETAHYLYITTELRAIGILAIIMFIGLFVLATILS